MFGITFNKITQLLVPTMTIGAQIALAGGKPEYGLIINLASQPFWIYSAWKAHKEANQSGLFITGIIFTFVTIWGIYNYWFRV